MDGRGLGAGLGSCVVSALGLPITFLNSSYCYVPLSLSGVHKQVFNFKVSVEVTLKVWEIPFPGCVWTQFLSPGAGLECGLPGGPSRAAEVAQLGGRLSRLPCSEGKRENPENKHAGKRPDQRLGVKRRLSRTHKTSPHSSGLTKAMRTLAAQSRGWIAPQTKAPASLDTGRSWPA